MDCFLDKNGKVIFSYLKEFPREQDFYETREIGGYFIEDWSKYNFFSF
jgi:hypothetical protein